ncbi:MAG: ParB/RepB/Spo0J family partition protein [Ruminococcaceae bacterium]|nr:ParB/RepB/Spo0J family partition protein [Oscillospiraceae bacterium]
MTEKKKPAKKAMGRGLNAFFDDIQENIISDEKHQKAEKNENSGTLFLKIRDIEPNPDQPRKHFEKEKLEALAESIKEHGLIQPIVVKPRKDGMYTIIAGERRWRAAKLAGLSEVPCVEGEYTEKQIMELALVENLQREDLNPIEEAEGYRKLMDTFGMTQEDVSQRVGKSRSAVANALRLNGLSEKLKAMVIYGELSQGHARALLSIEKEGDRLEIAEKIVEEGLNVRQVEKLVANFGSQKKIATPPTVDKNVEKYFKDLELEISGRLGSKVTIKNGKNKGKIEIEYFSNEELEGILEKIKK